MSFFGRCYMYNELQIIMDAFTMVTSVTHQWNAIDCDRWRHAVTVRSYLYNTARLTISISIDTIWRWTNRNDQWRTGR
jgi:hypothetical protein